MRLGRTAQERRKALESSVLQPVLLVLLAVKAGLGFAIAVEKEEVIGNGLFDKLLDQKHFGAVDDRMHALLKGLHGREGLERIADQNDSSVSALTHRHLLDCLER